MSNQTVKSWLKQNKFPASIAAEFRKFNITRMAQIKAKSSMEFTYMLEYLISTPSFAQRSDLKIPFKAAITQYYTTSTIPMGKYKLTQVGAGAGAEETKAPSSEPEPREPIRLGYLPLYKSAYLTYCRLLNSPHFPKEYVEKDNYKTRDPTQNWSGKVEVMEPFNLWAVSYDRTNPKRAIYKSYKKICNRIYFEADSQGFMHQALSMYEEQSGYISRRRAFKKRGEVLQQQFQDITGKKWTKKAPKVRRPQYQAQIPAQTGAAAAAVQAQTGAPQRGTQAQVGYVIQPRPAFAKKRRFRRGRRRYKKPVNVKQFIPSIHKYKNRSEFEKAEYLLCWERLKNNDIILDEFHHAQKWKIALTYLFYSQRAIMKANEDIINENMSTHKLRLTFWKTLNANGLLKAFEIYQREKSEREEKEAEYASDDDVVKDMQFVAQSTTTDGALVSDVLSALQAEAEMDSEFEEKEAEESAEIEVDEDRRVSTKLVITSIDETFVDEARVRPTVTETKEEREESEISDDKDEDL